MFQHRLGVLFLARGLGLDGPALHINVDLPLNALAQCPDGGADRRADILDAQPILPAQFPLHLIDDGGRLARVAIEQASTLNVGGAKSERLLNICRHFGASTYLTGAAADAYLDKQLFERNGVRVEWQRFEHPVYPQLHGAFIPYLSALDLLLNCGCEAAAILAAASPASSH